MDFLLIKRATIKPKPPAQDICHQNRAFQLTARSALLGPSSDPEKDRVVRDVSSFLVWCSRLITPRRTPCMNLDLIGRIMLKLWVRNAAGGVSMSQPFRRPTMESRVLGSEFVYYNFVIVCTCIIHTEGEQLIMYGYMYTYVHT